MENSARRVLDLGGKIAIQNGSRKLGARSVNIENEGAILDRTDDEMKRSTSSSKLVHLVDYSGEL